MATVDNHRGAGVASTGEKKNGKDHQASPTSVAALTIDVNSPVDQHSVCSPVNSKSRRDRGRRRKGKARGNQVEPVSSPSSHSRNNNRKKKSGGNNSYKNGNERRSNEDGPQQSSSSFRTPIVTWRGSRNPRSNNNNNRYNSNGSSNHNRHNNTKTFNHPSPRLSKFSSSPACPASTGYPTSKKQHDAPMKKRDLYFSLHVERVGIASKAGSDLEQHQQQQEDEQKAVARVTLTNWENEYVLDTFVVIPVPVCNFYETGIRPQDVQSKTINSETDETGDANTEAKPLDGLSCSFAAVRSKVERILRGKILIGYELDEGLAALGLSHPKTDMRDCATYFGKNMTEPNVDAKSRFGTSLLEKLSKNVLNRSFQSAKAKIAKDSPHNNDVMVPKRNSAISRRPVQICVTTMDLYKKRRNEWEAALIAEGRERGRQQQDYLLQLSQKRQQEQQHAQEQARQQAIQQQQYRENLVPLSMHCETVQTALSGNARALARVTIIDGPSRSVLLDEFSQIPVPVTDFCGTGITKQDVMIGNSNNANNTNGDASISKNPLPLSILRGHVERLLRGRLLVGYKVEESLKALGLIHPWTQIRDIAYYSPFLHNEMVGGSAPVNTIRSLDDLSKEFLGQQVRSLGDRSRPLDLCACALGLYECFRDQWERQQPNQQQDVYASQHSQQQQGHRPHQLDTRMIPPSPSSMMHSPNMHPSHYYGQQLHQSAYNSPMMTAHPTQQQLQGQMMQPEQHLQQENYSDAQPRPNSNSSSWFPWGKQQPQQQANLAGASQTLSSQAFQLLQEDSLAQEASPPKNHFFPVTSLHEGSAFSERKSSFTGSAYSEFSGFTSEDFRTDSVVSSMRDESMRDECLSVISSDHGPGNSPEAKKEVSWLPSSWSRVSWKKGKDTTRDNDKNHCETMAAVQETEVLTDDGMLPSPTTLFPSSLDSGVKTRKPKEEETSSDAFSPSSQITRFRLFRKSPVQKDRSRSPSIAGSESTFEDPTISALSEGSGEAAMEAIELTLSIPASGQSDASVSEIAAKPVTTSLPCRPSSSWFGLRRGSKPSGSKHSSNQGPIQSKTDTPALLPAPTERTIAMEDDWLQEVMSQSTDNTQDIEPWMNGAEQTNSEDIVEKPMSTSRGQASWFGFKRSKVYSNKASSFTNTLDSTSETFAAETADRDDTWSDGAASGVGNWFPEEVNNASVVPTFEHNENDIFHARARLPTESTIPSVSTEEPSDEEQPNSESYSKELDFGAAQSFNFLKI